MGYYSNYLQYLIDDVDYSYPSPEQQLLLRLDDLTGVLEAFNEDDSIPFTNNYCLQDDELRYIDTCEFLDPEKDYIRAKATVLRAIELAKEDLVTKYDMPYLEGFFCVDSEEYEKQLTFK